MRSTVTASSVTTQPNDLRDGSDAVRSEALGVRSRLDAIRATKANGQSVPNHKEILTVLRRVMAATGTSQKAFALTAGVPESEVSEALNGRPGRRFEIDWVWKQDDAFVIAFLDDVTETRGLTPEHRSSVRRQRIVQLIDLLLQETA